MLSEPAVEVPGTGLPPGLRLWLAGFRAVVSRTELWLSLSLLPVEPVAVFAVLPGSDMIPVDSGSLLSLGLKLVLAGTAGSDKYRASSEQAGTAGCIAVAESVFTIDSLLGKSLDTDSGDIASPTEPRGLVVTSGFSSTSCDNAGTTGCTAISGLEISVGCEDLAVVIM